MQSCLIIITGHPGTGKTTIARQLSEVHGIPYVSKDQLKEHMFDALGTGDKKWSLQTSAAAHRIMDDMIGQILGVGMQVIVESNFKADIDSTRFTTLINKYAAQCVQILCHANGDVLFARWNDRIARGARHGGHVEAVELPQIKHDLSLPYEPLSVPGRLIRLDTSDFSTLTLPNVA